MARFNDFAKKISEQSGGEMAEEPLVYALLGTHGKYESNQDRAKAIIRRLRTKKWLGKAYSGREGVLSKYCSLSVP